MIAKFKRNLLNLFFQLFFSREIARLKIEASENGNKTKSELNFVKGKLVEVESFIEKRFDKAIKSVKKMKVLNASIDKLLKHHNKETHSVCAPSFE